MSTEVQASVLHGVKDLRTEPRTLSAPGPNELQISIASTGLCGSDLHYYSHFRNGDILVREPLSLGHESAGIVTAIGPIDSSSPVTTTTQAYKVGDPVALEVGLPCSACNHCDSGRYNICSSMRFRSSGKSFPHFQGTLQQRINHPAAYCHKLPTGLSLDVGALLEPLGVALHAYRRSLMPAGASVLVFGAGAVGLLCAAVARMKGAGKVVIADIDAGRLAFATEHGFAHASYLVPMRRGKDTDENLAFARETATAIGAVAATADSDSSETASSDSQVDVVFECTGVPSCVSAAIYATRPGGRVMLVGMGHPVQTLPLGAAALREVDIVGVFRYANTYPESIALVQEAKKKLQEKGKGGAPDFERLVTHRVKGLERASEAFEMAGKTVDGEGKLVLKVVIDSSEV